MISLGFFIFILGIFGFYFNSRNVILMLLFIEVMLLGITLLIALLSYRFDDILGQINVIYVVSVAGAESAIGLGIIVSYYRVRGLEINYF